MITLYLKNTSGHGEIPSKLQIESVSAPRIGDTLNLFEVLTEEQRKDGWLYTVLDVEWTCESAKYLEPVIRIKKKKAT